MNLKKNGHKIFIAISIILIEKMGQNCTTETCCNTDGSMIGEVRGDGQSSQNLTVHERFRPMEMSDSARRRLMEIGA